MKFKKLKLNNYNKKCFIYRGKTNDKKRWIEPHNN